LSQRDNPDDDEDPEHYSKDNVIIEKESDYERMAHIKEMHADRPKFVRSAQTYINHPAKMQEFFRTNPEMKRKMERDPHFKELAENQDKIRALGKFALTPEYEGRPDSPQSSSSPTPRRASPAEPRLKVRLTPRSCSPLLGRPSKSSKTSSMTSTSSGTERRS
jgi:hypothetical protein